MPSAFEPLERIVKLLTCDMTDPVAGAIWMIPAEHGDEETQHSVTPHPGCRHHRLQNAPLLDSLKQWCGAMVLHRYSLLSFCRWCEREKKRRLKTSAIFIAGAPPLAGTFRLYGSAVARLHGSAVF